MRTRRSRSRNIRRSKRPARRSPLRLPRKRPARSGSPMAHAWLVTAVLSTTCPRSLDREAGARAGPVLRQRLDKYGPAPLSWAGQVLRAVPQNTNKTAFLMLVNATLTVVLLAQRSLVCRHVSIELRSLMSPRSGVLACPAAGGLNVLLVRLAQTLLLIVPLVRLAQTVVLLVQRS